MSLDCSVIVPTRNRSQVLQLTLDSILKQTLEPQRFEVIVVDNGSTDDTAALCQGYAERFANWQYVFAPRPGLHEGRHAGWQAARSPLLVYADDDIEAFETWLATIVEVFKDPRIGLAGGKNLPRWEKSPPYWLWEMWTTSLSMGARRLGALSILDLGDQAKDIDPYLVYGCNFSVRRQVLEQARGFHPDGMPQDLLHLRGDGESYISTFVSKQGYRTHYHPGASVYHQVSADRMTLEYFQRRNFAQGISASFTSVRERGSAPAVKTVSFRHRVKRMVLNHLLRRDITHLSEWQTSTEVERLCRQSFDSGYQFHQRLCREDAALLAWVLQPDYLGGLTV
jgi:glycosyltransferase involved in cell wall biosynthesis